MQVSEQDLIPAQLLTLSRERFLDLYDQLGLPIDRIGVCDHCRAGSLIVAVRQPGLRAGPDFYEHPVALVGEFADRGWHDTDPVFVVLNLFRHTDEHDNLSQTELA